MSETGIDGGNPQSNPDAKPGVAAPVISLPKGGGAIGGMGEKFAANPVTGTGALSIPIYTSSGRAGFAPQLSLSYDSGSGNGAFGFGWSLSLPSITRKTDKGLPRYGDAEESDAFILSGVEDLVPLLEEANGTWSRREVTRAINHTAYRIRSYRPRIEGLFARIERWTNQADPTDTFWRSISKDNVTTWYGKTAASRIADPVDPSHVFSWLICESNDDKGNTIVYEYKSEDSDGVVLSQAHERNRTDATRASNRYLKRVNYGNRIPYYPTLAADRPLPQPVTEWLFEVVLDYGEHDPDKPTPDDSGQWPARQDSFSSYRAGFEVRTYRLCQRVLMFHRFSELGVTPCLVRSTNFTYSYEKDDEDSRNPVFSFLVSATQAGYKRQADGSYLSKALPPLEFEYSEPIIQEEVREVDAESLENLPYGLDGMRYQWVDLDGEGLSGILTEQAEGWFYKRNMSPVNQLEERAALLGPVERVAQKPSLSAVGSGRSQFMDLAGDGQLELVELEGPTPGFYERTHDEGWESFVPFESLPNIDWSNPNLKFVDLTGDGHADLLISEDQAFCWHPSLSEAGFGPLETVSKVLDEEKGPNLVFADRTQSIHLADMSGDSLTDIVRIRNGEVCYWPNLGYGRFGAKVTMDNAPWFDNVDVFDHGRIRLADIDGSGVTDVIYLADDGVVLYFNQSGNSWSEPQRLAAFPAVDHLSSVQVVDLLGNGTACLVWSSPLPSDAQRPMRYVDLMGGQKPHLLVKSVNNLGAETIVHYAASTKFYLADKLAEKPWVTKLPFPVHVVDRVEIYDRVSGNRFVTRNAYHHGYFDGFEREFRGFSMVEQWDTEEFAALDASQALPVGTNIDQSSHVPPVLTRTWFHTGAYLDRNRISNFFAGLLDDNDAGEYYREPDLSDEEAKQLLLDDTVLPAGLTVEEEREACRALKGAMLRQEVYALDGTEKETDPYSVTEQNFTIRSVQPRGENRHAVFFTHAREAISYHYERNPADPRIAHALTLEVDDFGNVQKSAAIGYGRRQPDLTLLSQDQAKQSQTLITYTENGLTNHIDTGDSYRTSLPSETRTYELTGLKFSAGSNRFAFDQVLSAGSTAVPIAYEQKPTAGRLQKRLIEHLRSLYRRDDLTGPLPLGQLSASALPFETYKLALTKELISQVYADRVTEAMLAADCRYVHSEGDTDWWIPSGQIFLSVDPLHTPEQELAQARQHFFLPKGFRDPFDQDTKISYDAYDLLTTETLDVLGNRVRAVNDYRVLQPRLITDPNGNCSEVAFDTLGMVVGTAVMGKPEPAQKQGDSLSGFVTDLEDATVLAHLEDPFADPQGILRQASSRLLYDLFAFQRTQNNPHPQPATVYSLARETHDADLRPGEQTKIQHSFSYSDGFGREIQKKIQAEPGPVVPGGAEVNPRWVGNGWTIFNNKGKPVRQFEPFFSDTHRFEFNVRHGVSPILCYDPVQRVVATINPNHTWAKVVFNPWRQETWDVNDTVSIDPKEDPNVRDYFRRLRDAEYLPGWYAQRSQGSMGTEEQTAAIKAAVHTDTPSVAHMDSLGRPFLTVAHNKFKRSDALPDDPPIEAFHSTRIVYDIEGNKRDVIDALARSVMRYDYDLLGVPIYSTSMEAGERWLLNDVAGEPLYAWDSRAHRLRTNYDALRRPTEVHLQEGSSPEILVGQTVYGEGQPNAEESNLRGKLYQSFDGAGVVTTDRYDFKGNLLSSSRQLAVNYKNTLDWSAAVALEAEMFSASTTYDALNRPVSMTTPDNSTIHPLYNEANLLERVDANLQGSTPTTTFVSDIDYNAKGQRERIDYGNGVSTDYEYDPLTFRLANLRTLRGNEPLQDLSYTYDPVGNITHIHDRAQQTIYFRNKLVKPSNGYTYNSIYELIEATGREHLGQIGGQPKPPTVPDAFNELGTNLDHPGNGNAMGTYLESYVYDAVGNILTMQHRGTDPTHPGWTCAYAYDEASLIEPTKKSNRLSSTRVGNGALEPYDYDAHGSMTAMPHLPLMRWNYSDQLEATSRQVVNTGTPETTYYVYDGSGQRVRKVTEQQAGPSETATRMKERIYLGGGFEIYREYSTGGSTVSLERETLHLMDGPQRVALVETRTQGDDGSPAQLVSYQLSNHLGSTSVELDLTGAIISYEEYCPYGSTSYQALDASVKATAKRYRYTGKERDEETGLAYHGARYYAPWLGRWTSADPKPSNHRYGYALNSPQTHVDLDGKAPSPAPSMLETALGTAQIWAINAGEAAASLAGTVTQFASDMSLAGTMMELVGLSPLGLVPSEGFQAGREAGRTAATVVGAAEVAIGLAAIAAGGALELAGLGGGAVIGSPGGPGGSGAVAVLGGAITLPVAATLIAVGDALAIHGGAVVGANYMAGRPVDPKGAGAPSSGTTRAADSGHPTTPDPTPPADPDLVAKGEVSPSGTATINYRPNPDGSPHFTVEIQAPGGKSLETHLVTKGNRGAETYVTEVKAGDFKGNPTSSRTLELPDADAAMQKQLDQKEWGDLGQFNRTGPQANSCTTHVCDVVSAGGGPAPSYPAQARDYIYKLFGIPIPKGGR